MKRLLCTAAALLLGAAVQAQTPTLSPTEAVGFDYTDADLATYAVSRFEAAYDGNATYTSIGMVVSSTANGVTTYKTTPPQTSGTHTVNVRACNAAGCGAASVPFAFVVLSAPGSAPTNLHKVIR